MADPQKIGKYDIQGVLGQGAMGCVYRGFDPAISRAVAIKAISKSATGVDERLHAHMVQRFRHEARAAGRLVHPHIVQIYDYGEDDELAYIVMELVNGKTLAQHLQQEVSYDIREVGEIIRQLLDALQHAHAAGVVHRDVKPANILINNDGSIKVSDFGIARIESSHLTHVGDVIGTPHYMAPEQFLGQDVGPQADLFSVAVIAYELLVGRRPFTGIAAVLMQQVLNLTPVDPSQINWRLSPLMDRVLQTALAKQPADRFQNAREFAEAFAAAIEASLNAAATGATARVGTAPDGAALLKAAQLITSVNPDYAAPADDDKPPLPAGDSAISLDTGVRKARLLVIDDEERVLTALKSLFRDRYHVFSTTDGYKALDFMRKYQVHVIISDQRMPVMPGVELLRRSREVNPRSVRILLTGYSDLAAIVGSINDGEVYRFIAKPWDKTDLQTIVAEAATIALQLADTAAAPPALPHKMDAGVLVIAQDEEIFRVARELIGALCPVVHAADADAAVAVMRLRQIAVVITDLDASHAQLTTTLQLLKQECPHIVPIVVTTASDSELVIELINEAQIFRFLNKPVNVRFLKSHVHAALLRYLTFK
jgi:eukaryotic-like serine/threonine-protein kinase